MKKKNLRLIESFTSVIYNPPKKTNKAAKKQEVTKVKKELVVEAKIQNQPQPQKSTKPVLVTDEIINKASGLKSLQIAVKDCERCPLSQNRTNVVFGSGSSKSKILFIGEGPGQEEDLTGLPFVGRSGNLLKNMILAIGLKREAVFITNVVKCRPPNNRKPENEEISACSPILNKQIELINPNLIVVVGATAMNRLLPDVGNITNARGKVYNIKGRSYIVIYHPAYLLRNRNDLPIYLNDFRLIRNYLEENFQISKA